MSHYHVYFESAETSRPQCVPSDGAAVRDAVRTSCRTLDITNKTKFQEEIMLETNSEEAIETSANDVLDYNPNRLLDTLIERLGLKNDAAFSRALEVAPPVISKIRHGRLPVGASLLIRMHEVSGLSIRDLRYLMGDRRQKYRISDTQGKPKE
jgi:hypothetical protein